MMQRAIEQQGKEIGFSGVVLVTDGKRHIAEAAFGYANRAEQRDNDIDTRFGIASGCKLFTAIAICQLVERGILAFDMRLKECLDIDFPHIDEQVTIHQLLTHSSGISDYFDEEVMDDFEALWKDTPMYRLRRLRDMLPFFADKPMKFAPGERYHYNNAGFVLLGLIIEQHTGLPFSDYIEQHLFKPCGMHQSGYFSLDRLPNHTALGYIDEEDGSWRTNIYSIPVKGGADGGAFVTAPDMLRLWEGLSGHKLLSGKMTEMLLTPHVHCHKNEFYGYGIWIRKSENRIFKYHVMGYDPGVNFHSAWYPDSGILSVITSNRSSGAWQMSTTAENCLCDGGTANGTTSHEFSE